MAEMLTYSTVQIKCNYAGNLEGSGTGFIINICENKEKGTCVPILVTNRHVIENSTKISFKLCLADDDGNPIDTQTHEVDAPMILWRKHPVANVDLCCLPLVPILNHVTEQGVKVFYIPLSAGLIPGEDALRNLVALEDVVMIGYPIGVSDTYNNKPVIRRGITAIHPKNDYNGRKETLLDIAAFPGSSGSPVFIFNQGAYPTLDGIEMKSSPRIMLLGVLWGGEEYNAAGVLQFSLLPNIPTPMTKIPANLGIIIKSERIKEFETLFP